jgi:hypothetical protein
LPLLGWLLTAGAISLGAPFWFDLLNKFMVIRSTVKPHEKSLEEGSEDRQQGRLAGASLALPVTAGVGIYSGGGTATLPSAEPEFTAIPEPEFAAEPDPDDNESHIDGCDVAVEEPTSDEDLPPAEGGVG